MIRNIIITSIRNFTRQPLFSVINVAGLAVGIASTLLIMNFVLHETSYDNFHPDSERLYRVNQTDIWNPEGGQTSSSVIPLASVLVNDYAEIESAIRINDWNEQLVRHGEKAFYEQNILAADSNFFEFFGFELQEGNPREALKGVNKVVITKEIAQKFFGTRSPVGEILIVGDDKIAAEVTGVVAETPTNAHFTFDYLFSIQTNPLIKEFEWSWFMTPLVTYVKLEKGISPSALEAKFVHIAPKYAPATLSRFSMNYDDFVADKGIWTYYLQPVQDIHLHSVGIGNRLGGVSDINYIYIFSTIALFIILLGCINFINLSTARASARAKEVGVRKVMGSYKTQLILQFLLESIILCCIATLTGVALMEILRVVLNELMDVKLYYNFEKTWLFLLLLPVILGIVAGIYPSFYLTAFNPAKVLKGNLRSGLKSAGFRNSLVVTQFTVAIILLICTVFVYQQLQFLKNKHLGFDKENVIVINHAERISDQLLSFKNTVEGFEAVYSASVAMDVPGRAIYTDMFRKYGDNKEFSMSFLKIDPEFFETMNLQLVSGRLFQEGKPADHQTVIINETAAISFGWDASEALGKVVEYTGDDIGKLQVIGVVKDFHFQSLKYPVTPFLFMHHRSTMWGDDMRVLAIRYKEGNIQEIIPYLEKKWNEVSDAPFSYSFLDIEFNNTYKSEEKLGGLFSLFTGLSLFIACIGILGLAAYAVDQRSKEISVRKIFGAGPDHLVVLFSKEYLVLIIIAFVIAAPLSAYGIELWFDHYVLRVEQSIIPYITGIGFILIVAFLTILSQLFKAAFSSPVDALKND